MCVSYSLLIEEGPVTGLFKAAHPTDSVDLHLLSDGLLGMAFRRAFCHPRCPDDSWLVLLPFSSLRSFLRTPLVATLLKARIYWHMIER